MPSAWLESIEEDLSPQILPDRQVLVTSMGTLRQANLLPSVVLHLQCDKLQHSKALSLKPEIMAKSQHLLSHAWFLVPALIARLRSNVKFGAKSVLTAVQVDHCLVKLLKGTCNLQRQVPLMRLENVINYAYSIHGIKQSLLFSIT